MPLCHAYKQLIHTYTRTHTHLLLVAYPVRRLQALLQEGEAQLVYGRFVEVILHKAVTCTEESSAGISCVTINFFFFFKLAKHFR